MPFCHSICLVNINLSVSVFEFDFTSVDEVNLRSFNTTMYQFVVFSDWVFDDESFGTGRFIDYLLESSIVHHRPNRIGREGCAAIRSSLGQHRSLPRSALSRYMRLQKRSSL